MGCLRTHPPGAYLKLREFQDFLQASPELSSIILRAASSRNATSTGLEQYTAGDMFRTVRRHEELLG